MAISLKTAGTWARMVTDNGTVAIPGTPAAGDRMFLFGSWKTYTITVATPSGWTRVSDFSDGALAAGNGTGSVHNAVYYRDWQSGDAAPAIDYSAAPTEGHWVIMLWTKAGGDTWGAPSAVTAAIAAADPWSATSSGTVNVPDASVVMSLVGLRDDSTTIARSATTAIGDDGSPALTWNGDYVENPGGHFNSTTGNDMAGDLGHRLVTTGAVGVNLTSTGDPAAAETGSATWIVQGLITSAYALGVMGLAPWGYWRLGEASGAVDAVGNEVSNGINLNYLNTPTLGVAGLLADDPDTAVTFAKASSEDAYRGVGTSAGGSAGQSVAAWIKLGTFATAEAHAIWSWALQSTTIGFHTLFFNATDATNGTLKWRYSDGSSIWTATSSSFAPGTDTHFISVRHDYAAETVIFGIDGVEETVDVSANGAPVAIISGKPIDIGADVVNTGYYFNGTIDDVAVWISVLTAQNITDLYALGSGAGAVARVPYVNRMAQLLAH